MKTFLEYLEYHDPELMLIIQSYLDHQAITPEEGSSLEKHVQSGEITDPKTLHGILTKVAKNRAAAANWSPNTRSGYPTVGYGWGIPQGSGRVIRSLNNS